MPEYVITPDKTEFPSGPHLLDELHRRGFPVEIDVKGSADKWESIRFYEPGPPEIECHLSHDADANRMTVLVTTDSPYQAKVLQLFLVELLLREVGGQADNKTTRERFSPEQFAAKLKELHGASHKVMDLVWIFFSWAVVVLGVVIYFLSPQTRNLVPFIVIFSLLSAAGLTYSHFKT